MRWASYVVLVLLAAFIDHAWLSAWWWTPELSIALAAWGMVDGDEQGVIWRALLAGVARDLVDPAGDGFHTLVFTGLGFGFLALRRFLFRTRFAAWAVGALLCVVVERLLDGLVSGVGDLGWRSLLAVGMGTALAAMIIGWLFGGLPRALRPIGVGGA